MSELIQRLQEKAKNIVVVDTNDLRNTDAWKAVMSQIEAQTPRKAQSPFESNKGELMNVVGVNLPIESDDKLVAMQQLNTWNDELSSEGFRVKFHATNHVKEEYIMALLYFPIA